MDVGYNVGKIIGGEVGDGVGEKVGVTLGLEVGLSVGAVLRDVVGEEVDAQIFKRKIYKQKIDVALYRCAGVWRSLGMDLELFMPSFASILV